VIQIVPPHRVCVASFEFPCQYQPPLIYGIIGIQSLPPGRFLRNRSPQFQSSGDWVDWEWTDNRIQPRDYYRAQQFQHSIEAPADMPELTSVHPREWRI
jgi:hypothetical protein